MRKSTRCIEMSYTDYKMNRDYRRRLDENAMFTFRADSQDALNFQRRQTQYVHYYQLLRFQERLIEESRKTSVD